MATVFQKFSHKAIKAYQQYISNDYNSARRTHCMYTPSCSHYAEETIKEKGFFKGTVDAFLRLMRCNKDVKFEHEKVFFKELKNIPIDKFNLEYKLLTQDAALAIEELRSEINNFNKVIADSADRCIHNEKITTLYDKISFRTYDPVLLDDNEKLLFVVDDEHKNIEANHGNVSFFKKVSGNIAGGATAFICGTVGGGIGFVAGTCSGALLSGIIAVSDTKKFHEKLEKHFFVGDSVMKLAKIERKVGKLSCYIRDSMESLFDSTDAEAKTDKTPGNAYNEISAHSILARVLASAIGVPYGIIVGAGGGAIIIGEAAGKMGYYAGRNLANKNRTINMMRKIEL